MFSFTAKFNLTRPPELRERIPIILRKVRLQFFDPINKQSKEYILLDFKFQV